MKKFIFLLTFFSFLIFGSNVFAEKPSFRLLSYNVGLARGVVHHAKGRFPKIISKLRSSSADVICLQEVWKRKDQKKIRRALKRQFPYSYFPKKNNVRRRGLGGSCKIKDIFGKGKFVSCILKTCKGKEGEEMSKCRDEFCRPFLDKLSETKPSCAEGLIASIGKNDIVAILSLLNPFRKTGKFSFKGSYGTMLLSRLPLPKKKTGHFSMTDYSTAVNRGVIYSTINLGKKEALVACTHLTANISTSAPYVGSPPYRGPIRFKNNWANENYFQSKKMIEMVEMIRGLRGKERGIYKPMSIFLMGDFNCGPTLKRSGIEGDFRKSCNLFLQHGYADPVTWGNPECTFCKSNTLTDGKEPNMILDHIFIRGDFGGKVKSKVVYKEKVNIKINRRERAAHNLSDHFGILVTVPLF